MRTLPGLVGAVLAMALASGSYAARETESARFTRVVLANFERWDADHNGVLSDAEVERQVVSAQNTGEAAAAIAAIHGRITLKDSSKLAALTPEWFKRASQTESAPAVGPAEPAPDDHDLAAERDTETDLAKRFMGGLASLKRVDRTLWTNAGPKFTDLKQGKLGDCFLLAAVGAVAHRDPAELERMFKPLDPEKPGWIRVNFGDGKHEDVPPLTEAEIALGGASMKAGVWVRVLEKAYGLRRVPDDQIDERAARDEVRGGSAAAAASALTGHRFDRVKLVGDFTKEVKPEEVERLRTAVLDRLPKALESRRLVVTGTGKATPPKSITPNHAYAVLGYDAAKDAIELWNPHASSFKPKGDEGLVNGYSRSAGVFRMPLREYVRTFTGIAFETDQPATPPK